MSTATKTANKPQQRQQFAREAETKGYLTTPQEPRLPYAPVALERYGVDEDAWQALVDAIFPTAKSVAGVLLALAYCKRRNLDPFKRVVHIVPMWSAALKREIETVWPGIAELRTTAFRTGVYAGCDECRFGPWKEQTFVDKVKKYRGNEEYYEEEKVTVGFPEWAQMTVYRMVADQRVAFVGPKVRWIASYGRKGKTILPNDMWTRRTDEQIEKCAEAAALRRAFPEELGGEYSAEEMAGQVLDLGGGVTVETPAKTAAPKRSDFADKAAGAKDVAEDGSTEGDQGGAGEEEEPEGHELVDETGVVVDKIVDDERYCDAVIGLWEVATDLKHVQTIADNNREELDTLPKALGRKARDAFEGAKQRLSSKGNGKTEQKPAEAKAPPMEDVAGYRLKTARGKQMDQLYDAPQFILAINTLFEQAELKVDLENIYKHNAETIRSMPEGVQKTIVELYDQALVAHGQS
jgi:phage recombination protein Bet